jgi:hypothetical protein
MGVVPARDPGPGKTDGGVGKAEINNKTSLVPLKKGAAPRECVGSGTWDRVKRELGREPDGQKGSQILLTSTSQKIRVENGRRDRMDTHLLHLTLSK